MSSGAGHILDMMNRLKFNREQRTSSKAKFKEGNRAGMHNEPDVSSPPIFKTVSEAELNKIKNQIRERAKADQKKQRIIFITALLIGLSALITLIIAVL